MRLLTLVLVVLPCAACGGGSSDGTVGGTTLSGWYRYERVIGPTISEIFVGEIQEREDALLFAGGEHVREGDEWVDYDPAWYSPSRIVRRLHVVGDGQLGGVQEDFGRDLLEHSDPLTLTRASRPAGSFSLTGHLFGNPVLADDAPAHARVTQSPGSTTLTVVSAPAEAWFTVFLSFQQDPPVTPGTYDLVNTTLSNAYLQLGHRHSVCTAVTLVLTSWTAEQATGSFVVQLDTDEYLHGHFDVPIHAE